MRRPRLPRSAGPRDIDTSGAKEGDALIRVGGWFKPRPVGGSIVLAEVHATGSLDFVTPGKQLVHFDEVIDDPQGWWDAPNFQYLLPVGNYLAIFNFGFDVTGVTTNPVDVQFIVENDGDADGKWQTIQPGGGVGDKWDCIAVPVRITAPGGGVRAKIWPQATAGQGITLYAGNLFSVMKLS